MGGATETRTRRESATRVAPRYHVVLWDSPDHTYQYVIEMMQRLFAHGAQEAYEIARAVDTTGKAVCGTHPLEVAELRRDQIHAYGRDWRIRRCKGSMQATLERAP